VCVKENLHQEKNISNRVHLKLHTIRDTDATQNPKLIHPTKRGLFSISKGCIESENSPTGNKPGKLNIKRRIDGNLNRSALKMMWASYCPSLRPPRKGVRPPPGSRSREERRLFLGFLVAIVCTFFQGEDGR